jgi:archaellum component FlaC
MSMDVESEIRDLKRRVGEIEGTYGFLSGQVREVHRAVLGFQDQASERFGEFDERLDHVDARLERHDEQFAKIGRRFDGVDAAMQRIDAAVEMLPTALAEIVRAEFARRDREAGG